MKKSLISIAVASLAVLAAPAAYAAGPVVGTVTFLGQVTASTCTINVGGRGQDGIVTLAPTETNVLHVAGATANPTPFSIVLSGTACAGHTAARASFDASPGLFNAAGRVINSLEVTSTGAKNVDLQLLDKNDNVIVIGGSNPTDAGAYSPVDASGTATLNYKVQYYATGQATVGQVGGMVGFSLEYQ